MKLTTRFLLALAGAAVISMCHGTSQATERAISSTKVDYSAQAAELLGAMDRSGLQLPPRSKSTICNEAFDAAQKGDKDMVHFHAKHCAPAPKTEFEQYVEKECARQAAFERAGKPDASYHILLKAGHCRSL